MVFESIKKWLIAIGAGLLAIVTFGLVVKFRTKEKVEDKLKDKAHKAEIEMIESEKKTHEELNKIASDPDPDSRNDKLDAWLSEGLPKG